MRPSVSIAMRPPRTPHDACCFQLEVSIWRAGRYRSNIPRRRGCRQRRAPQASTSSQRECHRPPEDPMVARGGRVGAGHRPRRARLADRRYLRLEAVDEQKQGSRPRRRVPLGQCAATTAPRARSRSIASRAGRFGGESSTGGISAATLSMSPGSTRQAPRMQRSASTGRR